MSSWLLNIVGIVFIGVVLDIVLPEGKTNQFIKHIFSVFMLFVIINPVATFVSSTFSLNSNNNVVDSNFLYSNNLEKIAALEKDVCLALGNEGINGVSVIINGNVFDELLTINSVYVDLSNVEVDNNIETSEIKSIVLNQIINRVNVSSEDVVFYG